MKLQTYVPRQSFYAKGILTVSKALNVLKYQTFPGKVNY
jgi:hypothetical protein